MKKQERHKLIDISSFQKKETGKIHKFGVKHTIPIYQVLQKEYSFTPKKYTTKGKELFYSNLSTLIRAGIDIISAIDTILALNNNKYENDVLIKIKRLLEQGYDLSDSMKLSDQFSPHEYYSIKIGESGGDLVNVLTELQLYFIKKIKQKRLLISALSYPLIVLITSFGALFFMLKFIVPMYSEVFKRFDSDLPPLTKIILTLSQLTDKYFSFLFLSLIIIVLILFTQRSKNWAIKIKNKILMSLPIYGNILNKIYLSRFCQSMCLLLRSGTNLVASIDLASKMVGSYKVESALEEIQKSIIAGKSLYQAMSDTNIFDNKFISLVKVGEESNQLDIIFERLGNNYNDEVEYHTQLFGSYIEPILIIFLGAIVGIILVSMYLPLFKLGSTIK